MPRSICQLPTGSGRLAPSSVTASKSLRPSLKKKRKPNFFSCAESMCCFSPSTLAK